MTRSAEVARLAGVAPSLVRPAAVAQVRSALADRLPAIVLQVATQEPASYWRVGDRYYLDDPYFGDVVAMTDLAYDPTLGLHVRAER